MSFFKKLEFNLMALMFKIRDMVTPPESIVQETGIKEGQTILDYGCGPGSYSIAAAKLVGTKGKVYAADVSDAAMDYIRKAMEIHPNIQAIQTNCNTDLPDNSIDTVFLFDIYHDLDQPEKIMKELHRVLKNEGTLSFNDHHMQEEEILKEVTKDSLFKLSRKSKQTYNFIKVY